MKHYSAQALERHVERAFPKPLLSDDQVRAQLGGQLDGTDRGKRALAARLGISTFKLSLILRGRAPVPDDVAERLGLRRVTLFEPI